MSADMLDTAPPPIPDKLYFRVGETSRLVGVAPYVLRFWETEFPLLHPKKSGRGHRLYRRRDVELFLQIKHLLYEKRFTIEGARQALKSRSKPSARPAGKGASQGRLFPEAAGMAEVRAELMEILKLLR